MLFVAAADEAAREQVIRLVAELRSRGVPTEFSYRPQSLGKQLAAASGRGAVRCVIVGAETRDRGCVCVKELATGRQVERAWEAFLKDPMAPVT